MKFRTPSKTVETRDGNGFVVADVTPFKRNFMCLESNFTISTFCYSTRVTLENCVELRHYKWWSLMNYRVIVKRDGRYRVVDFRGVGPFKDPAYFESLGYTVTRIDKFWRRSANEADSEKYGVDFSTS